MKKKLLICFVLMMASAVSVFAQESEQEQTEVDSLVISKVVRFAKDLADTYQSIQNPYGTSASNGVSSSGLGGGDSAEPVTSDTLVVTRVDNNSTHSIVSADTVFFRHAADPYHPTLKDSVFVTRFTRSLQTGEPSSDTNYLKLDHNTDRHSSRILFLTKRQVQSRLTWIFSDNLWRLAVSTLTWARMASSTTT